MEAIKEPQSTQGEWTTEQTSGEPFGKQRRERREKRERPDPKDRPVKKAFEFGEVVTQNKRQKAMGKEGEIAFDKCQVYMERNAESLFKPKEITGSNEWLAQNHECGQSFAKFMRKKKNPLGPGSDTISLINVNALSDEDVEATKAYLEAFFPGVKFNSFRLDDFLDFSETPMGDDVYEPTSTPYKVRGKCGVLKKMDVYRQDDTYGMIALTNVDMYPQKAYKWADAKHGAAAMTFKSYIAEPQGADDKAQKRALQTKIHLVAHQICHMFGLRNDIYYEGIMNGFLDEAEVSAGEVKILGPVCQKKLKVFLNFDSAERLNALRDVCNKLGFTEEEEIYAGILRDVAEADIKAEDHVLVEKVYREKKEKKEKKERK